MEIKEHLVNTQNNFIGGWYLEDSTVCDDLIQYFKNNPIKNNGFVRSNDGYINVNKSAKLSIDCNLEYNSIEYIKYVTELQKVCNKYIEKYYYCNFYSPWSIAEGINIQYYSPNEAFFAYHTERVSNIKPNCDRHLVFMTYLNDIQTGGETEFFYQKLKIKPEKALTIIWPSDWTFTHRGLPSTTEKYIVTGWYNYM